MSGKGVILLLLLIGAMLYQSESVYPKCGITQPLCTLYLAGVGNLNFSL